MRIDLGGIIRTQTKPGPTPEEIQRYGDGIRKAVGLAGLRLTQPVEDIIPTLVRYAICKKDGVPANEKRQAADGRTVWYWVPNAEAVHAEEHRGLLMLGTRGTGKTVALDIVARITGAPMLSMVELGGIFKVGGDKAVQLELEKYNRSELILDDIGAETEARDYGDKLSARDIMLHRYEQWRKYGVRTHASSNLKPDQLIAETGVGPRVYDRLIEMCIPIVATGESLRGGK